MMWPAEDDADLESTLDSLARLVAAAFGPSTGPAAGKGATIASPVAPPAPSAPSKAETPAAPAAPAAGGPAAAPAAPGAPGAPKAAGGEGADAQRLSGKHWVGIAEKKWPESSRVEDLSEEFRPKAQAFLAMLQDNSVDVDIASTLRPAERAYLYHYCLEVAGGRVSADAVPKLATVDIEWNHGDAETSKTAASEMASAFGLVGVAAYPSNHSGGNALDMKMGFGRNTKDGKNSITYTVAQGADPTTRTLAVADEAVIGASARGKRIAGIADRELSKAGSDYGVKRAIDSDIVHWSLDGR